MGREHSDPCAGARLDEGGRLYGAKASRGGDGPVWLEAGVDQDILDDDPGVLLESLPAGRSVAGVHGLEGRPRAARPWAKIGAARRLAFASPRNEQHRNIADRKEGSDHDSCPEVHG